MEYTLKYLLENSKLPGRRANLELLYDFEKCATEKIVLDCLAVKNHDLNNTPEEFAIMCGVVGYCKVNKDDVCGVFDFLEEYAQSYSWRVRESVAMGIQSMLILNEYKSLEVIKSWLNKTHLHQRAMIAGLCIPKLQTIEIIYRETAIILEQLMKEVLNWNGQLSEGQKALRKALGYCWSIAIEANPDSMKLEFEKYLRYENKHIVWIVRSNLKKNRLIKLDKKWVGRLTNEK
ncbi:hypothetical protein [Fusibacter sp. JL216-2]|uniref:hypothetical protein n=1 Tax=Fusibacter sp. JL216-2 TaxID=3071453 RepID=UPI003D338DA7